MLLEARHEELINWRADPYSFLLKIITKFCKRKEKERAVDVHSRSGWDLNLDPQGGWWMAK
jgi:hypothetical protein